MLINDKVDDNNEEDSEDNYLPTIRELPLCLLCKAMLQEVLLPHNRSVSKGLSFKTHHLHG